MAKKTPTKKPKKKKTTLKSQAKDLSNAEYAGIIGQLEDTRKSARSQYDRFVTDRQQSLSRELSSNRQTGTIAGNVIEGRRGESMAALDKAIAARNAVTQVRNEQVQASNSEALSNFEAEMRAKGLDPAAVGSMKPSMDASQGYTNRLDAINAQSADDEKTAANRLFDTLAGQNANSMVNAEARARAMAQADFSKQYQDFQTKDEALASDLAKAKKDRGSSYLNTYMTLKKEYQQRKAEEAANRLQAAASMGRQASSDYFKQARLDLDTAKFNQKTSNDDRDYAHRVQKDLLNGNISKAKAIKSLKEAGLPQSEIDALLGTTKPKKTYTYYNPRTGKLEKSTS